MSHRRRCCCERKRCCDPCCDPCCNNGFGGLDGLLGGCGGGGIIWILIALFFFNKRDCC